MVYGEAGQKTLGIMVKTRMICYWHKTVTGAENKLSYKMTHFLGKLHEHTQYSSPWLKNIKHILNKYGMTNVWMNPNSINHNWLMKSIELRLSDLYIHEFS